MKKQTRPLKQNNTKKHLCVNGKTTTMLYSQCIEKKKSITKSHTQKGIKYNIFVFQNFNILFNIQFKMYKESN